jgi:hypothetical protein
VIIKILIHIVKHPEKIIKQYKESALSFESTGHKEFAQYSKMVADCLKERKNNDSTILYQDEYECRIMAQQKCNICKNTIII